jgi:hypothetical protein
LFGGLPATALPYIKMQLENGSLLAANLIVGAWTQVGRPELKPVGAASPALPPVEAAVTPAPPPAANEIAFVGSQDSLVYHRPTCSHASRIKIEKRVSFESADKAQAAGRTPCKTCKPDAK